MKQAVCPDDAIENHWISRYSKQPEICHAMQNIDGSDFYQNYLLKVNFTGESFISIFFFHILLFEDIVGKRLRFSPQGDGTASYTILTYKPKTMEQKRRMTDDESSPSDYVEIGHWSENNVRYDVV